MTLRWIYRVVWWWTTPKVETIAKYAGGKYQGREYCG